MKAVESLAAGSLDQEAFEIIKALPRRARGGWIGTDALYRASVTYQETSDLERAVSQYLTFTGRIFLGNSFSLNMLCEPVELSVSSLHQECVKDFMKNPRFRGSVVGHQDTANLYTQLLGTEIKFNRESITLERGDALLVGQYAGPRLPEGSTTLPDGASVVWLIVQVK